MRLKNPIILQLALDTAASEAFKLEVVESEMIQHIIGPDNEFESKEDWVAQKISEWISEVQNKFKLFNQQESTEISDISIISAEAFYKLSLGERIKFNAADCQIELIRIPGGWSFHTMGSDDTIFIPYSDEFEWMIKHQEDDDEG